MEITTFPIQFLSNEIKDNTFININTNSNISKEKTIRQALTLYSQSNTLEAVKRFQSLIDSGFSDVKVQNKYDEILEEEKITNKLTNLYKISVEEFPDNPEYYYYFGILLKDLKKLREAEIYFRKAIDLNPNIAMFNKYLGSTLLEMGKIEEAKEYTEIALKIKSDYASANNNLGVIFLLLGDLDKSEIYFMKALKCNYQYIDSANNFGDLLLLRGKFKQSYMLSDSILKQKSINDAQKTLAFLRITILKLIIGDFKECFNSINQTNTLINNGSLNTIKSAQSKRFICGYSNYITSILPFIRKFSKASSCQKIPHIGESHCLSFAHSSLTLMSEIREIQPVLITGAKAWHFATKTNNRWKSSLNDQIKNHTYSKFIFISFGEIDCRREEGILPYSIKYDKDISEVCKKTIVDYFNYMEAILSDIFSKRYYFGVPAPMNSQKKLDRLDIMRIELVKIFNSILRKEVLSRGSSFLDVYELTSLPNGTNNNLYMCDEVHLSPKSLTILFENHLYNQCRS